jgi:hypothetical protein
MITIATENIKNINYSVHEAGHVTAACHREMHVFAELKVQMSDFGSLGAATWFWDGTPEDDVFVLYAGIETSKLFGLGEAGTLKDVRDIGLINVTDSVKQDQQIKAERFVRENKPMILKMAYTLWQLGELPDDGTLIYLIFNGAVDIAVPRDFLAIVESMPRYKWKLVKSDPVMSSQC